MFLIVKQTRNISEKLKTFVHSFLSKVSIFLEPPLAPITAASLWTCLCKLGSYSEPQGFLPILQGRTALAPPRRKSSACVQQLLNNTIFSVRLRI